MHNCCLHLGLPQGRVFMEGKDRKHLGSGSDSQGQPAEICPVVWVWNAVEQELEPVGSTLHACCGRLHGAGVVEWEVFLGILARRTWRSWCDLTCGGCVARAPFSCPQSSEEDAPPAGAEWSRGRGEISVSAECLRVLIPASRESFGICGSLPGFLPPL